VHRNLWGARGWRVVVSDVKKGKKPDRAGGRTSGKATRLYKWKASFLNSQSSTVEGLWSEGSEFSSYTWDVIV
jgi:hypothetical protein